ncbi:Alpha/Beta hydrolase protein [Trichoderma sp. SZMC 28014]
MATSGSSTETKSDSAPNAMSQLVETYAQLFKNGQRSPILRRPDEYGMKYEDIFFPSLDGTILQGWFIPAPNSKKLIIANHPMTCNRYGYPGHLEEFGGFGGFEVNFLPDYKALHDAGYNIICYDLRNHGISDQGSGGMCGALGYYEARDVVGSLIYARSRSDTKENTIGLLSRCMGGNATIHAMTHFPEHFNDIKAMVLLQAVSGHAFVEKGAINAGLDVDETVKAFDKRIHDLTGFYLKELSPIPLAKNVTVPTLFAQVRKDALIDTKDTQEIFDALSSKEKQLIWIEDTTRRFDGYNYFANKPAELVEWFGKYV